MMEQFINTWGRWREIKTRASRKEFWGFIIINYLLVILAAWNATYVAQTNFDLGVIILTLASIYTIISLPPMIAVSIRRMHDIGRSGWWVMIHFLPIIGNLWFFILAIQPSKPISNEYGESTITK